MISGADITIDEQIKIFENNAEIMRKEGDLRGCLNFRQNAEWLKELKMYKLIDNTLKETRGGKE